jgi:hypothetical protein
MKTLKPFTYEVRRAKKALVVFHTEDGEHYIELV